MDETFWMPGTYSQCVGQINGSVTVISQIWTQFLALTVERSGRVQTYHFNCPRDLLKLS